MISNKQMIDMMEIVKSLEEVGLLIKDVSQTIKNEAKDQKGGFIRKLLAALGASLLGYLLTSTMYICTNVFINMYINKVQLELSS